MGILTSSNPSYAFAEIIKHRVLKNRKDGLPSWKDAYSFWRSVCDRKRGIYGKLESHMTTEAGIRPEDRRMDLAGIYLLEGQTRYIDHGALDRMVGSLQNKAEPVMETQIVPSSQPKAIDVTDWGQLNKLKDTFEKILYDENEFCVDFDAAWQWIGYSRKDVAKRTLVKDFVEGIDYHLHNIAEVVRPQGGGSQPEKIMLTIDCFKQFCMMAGTAQGKQVRLYFLECEKRLKQIKQGHVVFDNEGLQAIGSKLDRIEQDGQLTLKELSGVKERLQRIEDKQDPLAREGFSKKVEKQASRLFIEKWKGKCIVTGAQLFENGERIPGAVHMHHMDHVPTNNDLTNVLPVSPEGHRILHSQKLEHSYKVKEDLWKAQLAMLKEQLESETVQLGFDLV
jgi:phage anti-repressor protein